MKYVKDSTKLANIMRSLAKHEVDVKQYFLAVLMPRITAVDDLEDKLVKLFVLANADRLGTGKDNENLVKATATFRKYLSQDIISSLVVMTPSDAHQHLLTGLCDIKWMDQKTANLLLKSTVMFAHELNLSRINWRSWEPYLHVPLDKWVLRLIGKDYLHVCSDNFETDFQYKGDYPSPSLKTDRYAELQDDIKQVAASANLPPIVLDSLWFVGSHYCSYHPLLCDICWLGEYCAKHEIVDWNKVPTTLKSAELQTYKQNLKAFREIKRIWKSENPGKTDGDFYDFLQQPEGREWLSKFLKE
jgi:hypothetical protein